MEQKINSLLFSAQSIQMYRRSASWNNAAANDRRICTKIKFVGFEVLTAVTVKFTVLWTGMWCRFGRYTPMFWSNLLLLSSWERNDWNKLRIETDGSFKNSLYIYQGRRSHILEDTDFPNYIHPIPFTTDPKNNWFWGRHFQTNIGQTRKLLPITRFY